MTVLVDKHHILIPNFLQREGHLLILCTSMYIDVKIKELYSMGRVRCGGCAALPRNDLLCALLGAASSCRPAQSRPAHCQASTSSRQQQPRLQRRQRREDNTETFRGRRKLFRTLADLTKKQQLQIFCTSNKRSRVANIEETKKDDGRLV